MAQPDENIIGIFRQAHGLIEKFDRSQDDPDMGFRKKMLYSLEEPYGTMFNESEMYEAICSTVSEEEAEAWFCYPDFSFKETPVTMEEAYAAAGSGVRASFKDLTESLSSKKMLIKRGEKDGRPAYMRTYMFYLTLAYVNYDDPHKTPLGRELLRWWIQTNEGGSGDFPTPYRLYRIMPHEGTLTGKDNFGKVPMNLEIPDTRQVLDMDLLSKILKERRTIAVTRCICRNAQEKNGTRKCDYPLDVCIGFDAVADGLIASGAGRQITAEECERIVRTCHEMGMMQIISNSDKPLAMCNCCRCCCGIVKSMARFESSLGTVSRYVASMTDASLCVQCKSCVKVCPMETISIKDGHAEIFQGNCFGCGLCVSKCPKGILTMKVRSDAAESTFTTEQEKRLYI